MISSFLRWVVSLSRFESLVRSSKRVWAEIIGFLHLFCTNELKGPNGVTCELNEQALNLKRLSLELSNSLMGSDFSWVELQNLRSFKLSSAQGPQEPNSLNQTKFEKRKTKQLFFFIQSELARDREKADRSSEG